MLVNHSNPVKSSRFSTIWSLRAVLDQAQLVADGVRDVRLHDVTCNALTRTADTVGVDREWDRALRQSDDLAWFDAAERGGSVADEFAAQEFKP